MADNVITIKECCDCQQVYEGAEGHECTLNGHKLIPTTNDGWDTPIPDWCPLLKSNNENQEA
jgi:hypothetical protein